MNILLLGSGGREHALAWKLAQSPALGKLYAAPGNPGIAQHATCVLLDAANHDAVAAFCAERKIALVVIGPEAPLVDGLADSLRARNIAVFGPGRAAAQLEGSKAFTKALCTRANIPTARYAEAHNEAEGLAALADFALPVVIKADGLAAGKGVLIAHSSAEAEEAVRSMFDGTFGEAGLSVVIEQFLEGEEASFFALTDGQTILPFGTAQDHKRVGQGDSGPNTGGMGAYSPAPVLTSELLERAMAEIVRPTVETLAAGGTPYSGVLYAGLMLTDQGPQLIEYNCRFGDPECQVLMMRLESDLAALMLATAEGRLAEAEPPRFVEASALTVVMAAKGYPGSPEAGGSIALNDAEGGESAERGTKIFQAGTQMTRNGLIATGGRVLNVCGTGQNVAEAQRKAYEAVAKVDFPSGFYRRDIGWREIEREG